MSVVDNTLSEIGDELIITMDVPIMGLESIDGFTDVVNGELGDRYFTKYFKYTVDGLNFSDWYELTNGNLQSVDNVPDYPFKIYYKYIRDGDNPAGLLEFVSIELDSNYDVVSIPDIYNNTVFSKFLDFYDYGVINWAFNVLDKLYNRGIVASYIERNKNKNLNWEDRDYLDFFRSICHLFSLIVCYGRKFEDINNDVGLLEIYLQSEGLYLSKNMGINELFYLMEYFYNEIEYRGTVKIVEKKTVTKLVDGELLRLINYKENDEFIFCYCEIHKSNWNIDNCSPLYQGTKQMVNCIKGYELTEDFEDLGKYPLINGQYCFIVHDDDWEVLEIDDVPYGSISGIGVTGDMEKEIIVDSSLDYEITFLIKEDSLFVKDNITFGVKGFDKFGYVIDFLNVTNLSQETNYFFQKKGISQVNRYYLIRGIIYNKNMSQLSVEEGKLNIGLGNNLVFKDRIAKIVPYLVLDATDLSGGGTGYLKIHNFKVRPLKTDFSTSFLDVRNLVVSWIKNNAGEYSETDIENIMKEYLLPYNVVLKNIYL